MANRTGKPWSGHTINRIIANPAYTGDIAYGDVYAENSHEPLIDPETWNAACAIATARTETAGQRAMSDSDYQLTGLITCPTCGHKYIGTAATGRNRVYRYYTCFSRARYGTHGCQATRLPAEALDTAILTALADFYTHHTALINDAVTRAIELHRDGHTDAQAEHTALLAQIKQKETAVDRYCTAFENGTMTEEAARQRLTTLRMEIAQLTVRAAELEDALGSEPTGPPPGVIERLQTHLTGILTSGTPGERKATIEALVAEIRLTQEGVIPVFRIPGPHTPIPETPGTSETDETTPNQETVRIPGRLVGRLGLEPRTYGLKVRCSTIELTPRNRPGRHRRTKRTDSSGDPRSGDGRGRSRGHSGLGPDGRDRLMGMAPRAGPQRRYRVNGLGHGVGRLLVVDPPADEVRPRVCG